MANLYHMVMICKLHIPPTNYNLLAAHERADPYQKKKPINKVSEHGA